MFWLDSLKQQLMTAARKERFAYMRAVPLRRLGVLMAAAFFVFATLGLQNALVNRRAPNLESGIVWALFTGMFATIWVLAFSRKPAMLVVVLFVQVLSTVALQRYLNIFNSRHPTVPLDVIVQLYALLSVLWTASSYGLFLGFIGMEGRFAFRAQTELALAHGIQKTLAPALHLTAAGCEFYGVSVPSDKVGGDLVDVVPLPDGRAVAYVADIAGHGLQAGILMGMFKTAARTRLLDSSALPSLFDRLNRVLPSVKEAHMYATAAALLLETTPDGCVVEYALAGHPPILHVSGLEQRSDLLSDEQFPLGLMPRAEYRSQTTHAVKGDLMVVTTDGVLEVCNKNDDEFGSSELRAVIAARRDEPLPRLATHILNAATAWGKQEDDQTLLLIRVL